MMNMLVGARVEQNARVLHREGREDHDVRVQRVQRVPLAVGRVVLDPGGALPAPVHEHTGYEASVSQVRARGQRLRQVG
jgi:hypothetical protein